MDNRFLAFSLVSFIIVLLLTPATRWLASRVGMVRPPRPDRWHTKPTALLGGLPIFLGFAMAMALTGRNGSRSWGILAGSASVFLLGLLDDCFHLRPFLKVVGVILASGLVLQSGLHLPWFESPALNVGLTIFWMVGITNALNLLDNMDGLAAGIAAIAALFLALSFLIGNQPEEAMIAGIFAGAVLGFLVYNFPPASIFMGEIGRAHV